MKNIARITLLSFWLFAILAPSMITLLNDDQNVIVSISLNEEEQKEQSKTDIDKKLIVETYFSNSSITAILRAKMGYDYYLTRNFDTALEIVLPPPRTIA